MAGKPQKRDSPNRTETLIFLHGLKGSPTGTKATLIQKLYPQTIIPDLPQDLTERVQIVSQIAGRSTLIIGSSLGGLTALMYAANHRNQVKGLMLLSPAVGVHNPSAYPKEILQLLNEVIIPPKIPTVIIAAEEDEVIPLDAIKALVARSPDSQNIHLSIVQDTHTLSNSLDIIKSQLRTFCDRPL